MNLKVDDYISKKEDWQKELALLRSVILDLSLEETIKWGAPTYVYKNKNVVGLAAFKNYCGLWFFQGALLKDKYKVFINAQEGKTKAMLQWRFYNLDEINVDLIKEYVLEACKNVDKGIEIKPERNTNPVEIPDELLTTFNKNNDVKLAFKSLSIGKQREYANYISEAKRASTRLNRLEKIIPMILKKIGLYDKYKSC